MTSTFQATLIGSLRAGFERYFFFFKKFHKRLCSYRLTLCPNCKMYKKFADWNVFFPLRDIIFSFDNKAMY